MTSLAVAPVQYSPSRHAGVAIRRRVSVPMGVGVGDFVTFTGLSDPGEHVAIVFQGPTANTAPLVRVHSECLTGDVFMSGKCDCGEQLREAVTRLQRDGGVLV